MPSTDHNPIAKRKQQERKQQRCAPSLTTLLRHVSRCHLFETEASGATREDVHEDREVENARTFCNRCHSLTVQRGTVRRVFEDTMPVAARQETL